jgi:transcriptional regulator with XRE-family HTH domain
MEEKWIYVPLGDEEEPWIFTGANLKLWREQRNFTLEEMAYHILKVSPGRVWQLEQVFEVQEHHLEKLREYDYGDLEVPRKEKQKPGPKPKTWNADQVTLDPIEFEVEQALAKLDKEQP